MKALALFSLIVLPQLAIAQASGQPDNSFSLAQREWHKSGTDLPGINNVHFVKFKTTAEGNISFCPYDPSKEWKETNFIQDAGKARPQVITYEVLPDYAMQQKKWWGNQYNNLSPGYNYGDSYLIQSAWNLGLYLLDPDKNK